MKIRLLLVILSFPLLVCANSLKEHLVMDVKFNEKLSSEYPLESVSNKVCSGRTLGEVYMDDIMGCVRCFVDPTKKENYKIISPTELSVSGASARTFSFWFYMEDWMQNPGRNGIDRQNKAIIFSKERTWAMKIRFCLLLMAANTSR